MFSEQHAHSVSVWRDPLVPLRAPKIFNPRRDPFERAEHEAISYEEWWIEHIYIMYGGAALSQRFVETFKEFPPRQRPASFSIDQIMEGFNKRHGQ